MWRLICGMLFVGVCGAAWGQMTAPCDLYWRPILSSVPVEPSQTFPYATSAWAYDSTRRLAIFFDPATGDLWEFNGSTAVRRDDTFRGPGERDSPVMIYDDVRRRCVLYGGYLGIFWLNDLWEFDGEQWVERLRFDPDNLQRPGEISSNVVFDSARARTVFVDSDGTWEWDGVAFTNMNAKPPLWGQELVYDPKRQVVLAFGGLDPQDNSISNDTWSWDGNQWTQVATEGPSPRILSSMVYDPRRDRILLFGGRKYWNSESDFLGDTWEWDGASWSLLAGAGQLGIGPLRSARMWYDAVQARVVMAFGATLTFPYYSTTVWEARPPGLWVDFLAPGLPAFNETGFYHEPFNTLGEAVVDAADGCTLNIKAGTVSGGMAITKPLLLDAYFGSVVLGEP